MSEILRPGRTALLLSEVQRSVIGDLANGRPLAEVAQQVGVIPNAARLARAARERGAPVVHCLANTAPGRFGANTNGRLFRGGAKRSADGSAPKHDPNADTPCPEVWLDGDLTSKRDHGLNPMADTQLDRRLRNEGITTIVVAGVSINMAIMNMTMEAVNSAYNVVVARDAVSGYPLEYSEPVIANTLSLISTVATVDEIIAAWPKG
jgi:nicotinamidase-related amidase